METMGAKGRIHCSQATADEIVASGRSHWLVIRPEKISAKGKGEMQTYWINPGATTSNESYSNVTEESNSETDLMDSSHRGGSGSFRSLTSVKSTGGRSVSSSSNLSSHNKRQVPADSFTDTTVLFGDFVGFTEWSETVGPEQVFRLLERLYLAFDEIANVMGVTKVESVSDAYLAITGAPNQQLDHAAVMCMFAFQCIARMRELVTDLDESSTEEAGKLAFRAGLHSGEVMAGVIQSDRPRFQVFGASVKMAQLMGSTGSPDRIHCSEATADELTAAGKSSWLSRRRVEAERCPALDGITTSYFVRPTSKRSSSAGTALTRMIEGLETIAQEKSDDFSTEVECLENSLTSFPRI